MKTRAVKLFLGKVALKGIALPQTSYRFVTYRTPDGGVRHRRVEGKIQYYRHSATSNQRKFGIVYDKGSVKTRAMNTTDLATLHDPQAAKARPIAHKLSQFYLAAVEHAIQTAAANVIKLCNQRGPRAAQTLQPSGQQKRVAPEESPINDSGSSVNDHVS